MTEHPIPFETLVALWAGELADNVVESIEEHLFACDQCAEASDQLGNLVAGLREFVPPVISHAQRDELATRLNIKQLAVTQPTGNEIRFTSDLDLYVMALGAKLTDAERVDVEMVTPDGISHLQFLHVPFDASRGEVLIACQRHFERFDNVLSNASFKVFAHRAGQRREVASYHIKHIWL